MSVCLWWQTGQGRGRAGQGRHPPTGLVGDPQQPSRWSSCSANGFFLLSSPAYVFSPSLVRALSRSLSFHLVCVSVWTYPFRPVNSLCEADFATPQMTETTSRKDVRMLNEASLEFIRSSIPPSSVRSVTPSLYWESDTIAFCPRGGGGRLEGRFFFSSCIWCGQWTVDFPCKFYLGTGGRIYFPFSQWEGPMCLAFIPFKLGGRKGFFFHFSLFPNVFSRCSL